MTNGWDMLDKGMIHVLGRMEWGGTDFIKQLRMVYNLKAMNCLCLKFSIYHFGAMGYPKNKQVDLWVTEKTESKTTDKRGFL